MSRTRPIRRFAVAAAAVAAVFAFSALEPAQAQQRKSLRWATSPVGS